MEKIKEIDDIYVVAYLHTKGYRYTHETFKFKSDGYICNFLFPLTPQLEKDLEDYYSHKALIDPNQFYAELRAVSNFLDVLRETYGW